MSYGIQYYDMIFTMNIIIITPILFFFNFRLTHTIWNKLEFLDTSTLDIEKIVQFQSYFVLF